MGDEEQGTPKSKLNEQSKPSYQTVLGSVDEVKSSSSGPLSYVYNFLNFIIGTTKFLIASVFALAVPISMIIIGSIFIDDCRAEKYIPIYLIVGGAFGVLKCAVMNLITIRKKKESETTGIRILNGLSNLMSLFTFAWLIAGTVWVYGVYKPDYNNKLTEKYCNETVYVFAFCIITITYILFALFIILSCCLAISSIKKKDQPPADV